MAVNRDDFDGNLRCGGASFHDRTNRRSLIEPPSSPAWGAHFFNESSGGGLSRVEEKFRDVERCPLCQSSDHRLLLETQTVRVHRCESCEFGFQNPTVKPELVGTLYEEHYSMEAVYDSELGQELDFLKFLYGCELALEHGCSSSAALDIGTGSGLALEAYRKLGFGRLVGVEPAPYNFVPGIEVVDTFEETAPQHLGKFSLVTLWDTLEHLSNPGLMLESIPKILDESGRLLVCVPNLDSLATRLIREKSPTFQLDHLNYFSLKNLVWLLESTGFNVIHAQTIISEIDNCRNYLEFREPYFSSPRYDSSFKWLTPDYIHANMLGSRLLVVAAVA